MDNPHFVDPQSGILVPGHGSAGAQQIADLPSGPIIYQKDLAVVTTNTDHNLSNPASGMIITLFDGATADPDLAAFVSFDAPNNAVRDEWMDLTKPGPRIPIGVNETVKIYFKLLNGQKVTVQKIHYKFSANTAGSILRVGVIS